MELRRFQVSAELVCKICTSVRIKQSCDRFAKQRWRSKLELTYKLSGLLRLKGVSLRHSFNYPAIRL